MHNLFDFTSSAPQPSNSPQQHLASFLQGNHQQPSLSNFRVRLAMGKDQVNLWVLLSQLIPIITDLMFKANRYWLTTCRHLHQLLFMATRPGDRDNIQSSANKQMPALARFGFMSYRSNTHHSWMVTLTNSPQSIVSPLIWEADLTHWFHQSSTKLWLSPSIPGRSTSPPWFPASMLPPVLLFPSIHTA